MTNNAMAMGLMVVLAIPLAMGGCTSDDEQSPVLPAGTAGASGVGGASGASGRPELTGAACEEPADCYRTLEGGTVTGDVICLDQVRDGYCTHTCSSDDDCCSVPGECPADLRQVCAPFESTGQKMCFLSCEGRDIRYWDSGTAADEQTYCQQNASDDFVCRSSGGGSENRKVCVPGNCGVGASCTVTEDCAHDLECLTTFAGGYCTVKDCVSNEDCPQDALCVKRDSGEQVCLDTCNSEGDCSFCRPTNAPSECRRDVTFVVPRTATSVCVPPSW